MTVLRCLDCETTGLTADDAICEIGWSSVTEKDGGWSVSPSKSVIVNPHRPIDVIAVAIHHITDDMTASGMETDEALAHALNGSDVLVAHNAKYEQQYIKTDIPWICTYRVAAHLAPEAPSHSLQVLRYWLKLEVDPVLAMPPHRAGPDAFVTAHMLVRMLAKLSIQDMIDISSRPVLLSKFRFGKHANIPLAQVPKDYLQWMMKQDFDEDVKYTAKHYLEVR